MVIRRTNETPVVIRTFVTDEFHYAYMYKEDISSVIVIKEDGGDFVAVFPATNEGTIGSLNPLLCHQCSSPEDATKEWCRVIGKLSTKADNSKYFHLQLKHPQVNEVKEECREGLNKLILKIAEYPNLVPSSILETKFTK